MSNSHPLDKASTDLAMQLAPPGSDYYAVAQAVALSALTTSALLARLTDELDVGKHMDESGAEIAQSGVAMLLDLAHWATPMAGNRQLSAEEIEGFREMLENSGPWEEPRGE